MMSTKIFAVLLACASARRAPASASLHSKHTHVVYTPRTPAQSEFAGALAAADTTIVAGMGPAGCGKTVFACMAAARALESGTASRVIFTRPLVPVDDESLGFFPGTMASKMEAWTVPFFDAAREILGAGELARLQRAGLIEVVPLAYMRGRTFKDAFVIADEMQNSSPAQVFMLATRLGEGSRLALLGDARQSDRVGVNGLADFVARAEMRTAALKKGGESCLSTSIRVIRFGATDVQRSAIVAEVVHMYADL